MYFANHISITFTYKGKAYTRTIDKIKFSYDDYSYTLYRILGVKCNYNLLKCGKWWQVNIVQMLDENLIQAIGSAIDAIGDGD
jgi:hypothetical protein